MGLSKKDIIIKTVYGVLFISILVNVFLYWKSNDYRKLYGEKSYGEIERIYQKNGDINDILSETLKTKEISKMDLIKLKASYEQLYSSMWTLKDDYANYKKITLSTHISNEDLLTKDVLSKIRPYLTQFIENNINTAGEKIKLKGDNLKYFIIMNRYSDEIDNFFNYYVKSNTKGNSVDSLKSEIQKDGVWVNILDNLCKISDEYFVNDFAYKEDTKANSLADSN